ncbi:MAG TPA: FG-GAP-like repeat-containing protein, partial [Dehalococcoidia bacterium]|nr:FG-GAP-like repeat-containing protein [Dehalococcoidia bacterium]
NGEDLPDDGGPITIGGQTYVRGLGVHAPSDLRFPVPDGCASFTAEVGVDDEVGAQGSVTFEVWDGTATRLYQSPVKTGADGATAVNVDISGVSTLRLVVAAGTSTAFDHADWADAKLACENGDFAPPAIADVVAVPGPTFAVIAWDTDEIADAQVEYGVTAALGSATAPDTMLVMSHAVVIEGLEPSTTYHYRPLSRDPAGNAASGDVLTFTTQASLFGPPQQYAAGANAHDVEIADLDGDTHADLVTADAGANTVSVLLGAGDGTFAAPVAYATGSQPKSVALGDVDGDGHLDAVTANQGSSNLSVLPGNGAGAFGAKTDLAACTNAHEVTLAPLDADADLDIACVGWGAPFAGVRLNNGDGTFAAMVSYAVGPAPHSIAAADLDGDADIDLATADHDSDRVSVLLNNGSGGFGMATPYPAGSRPHSIRAADLDGDDDADLVTANHASDNVSVFLNSGNGTFAAQATYAAGNTPKGVTVADIDGDSIPDVLTANIHDNYPALTNPGGDTVSVLVGLGNGTFAEAEDYAVGQGPFAVAAGRLDGDAKLDVATADWWDAAVTVRLHSP